MEVSGQLNVPTALAPRK